MRVLVLLVAMGSCIAVACDRNDSTERSRTATPSPSRAALTTTASAAIAAGQASSCAAICERTKELHCSAEGLCMARCLEMSNVTVCGAEIQAVIACMKEQPLTSFECDDEEGGAALREGVCNSEQAHFAACYESRASSQ